MLKPDQDWVRVYCDTRAQADSLKKDVRFMAPIYEAAFERMLRDRQRSVVVMEISVSDTYKPEVIVAKWDEVEACIDMCIDWLTQRQDFEECARLFQLKRTFHARELEEA